MESLNYIINATHISRQYGADGSLKGFLLFWREKVRREKGVQVEIKGLAQGETRGNAVLARIWQGQWIADCECGGAEFVYPQEPVFFCWSCVNRGNGGYLRRVVMPDEWREIEAEVLKRPVYDVKGATDTERAFGAKALVLVKSSQGEFPLTRSWRPEESLDELRRQNAVLEGLEVQPDKTTVVEVRDGV